MNKLEPLSPPQPANTTQPFSLLACSVWQRLGLVVACLLALWLAALWAMYDG